MGKVMCLIVENTFTSIPDMAKVLLGWRILQYFPLFFYKNKVRTGQYRDSKINLQKSKEIFLKN